MNNILLYGLPQSLEIDGILYPVNWGYRAFILIEICIYDPERSDEQKVLDILNIFYERNIPPNQKEALEKLLWFYRCGRQEKEKGRETEKKSVSNGKSKRSYCFQQDAPYIYAGFMSQYGLDLNGTKNKELHWWKFFALFESLNEELKICKIMYYRTAPLSGLGKEQKKFINEMKKLYALEDSNQGLNDKVRLSKRNADMKSYIRRRAMETYESKEG